MEHCAYGTSVSGSTLMANGCKGVHLDVIAPPPHEVMRQILQYARRTITSCDVCGSIANNLFSYLPLAHRYRTSSLEPPVTSSKAFHHAQSTMKPHLCRQKIGVAALNPKPSHSWCSGTAMPNIVALSFSEHRFTVSESVKASICL